MKQCTTYRKRKAEIEFTRSICGRCEKIAMDVIEDIAMDYQEAM